MATYYADGYDSNITGQGCSDSGTGCSVTVPFEYQVTAALVQNDVLHLVPVPKGAILTELALNMPDIDSTNSTWQFDLGDTDSATTFGSNLTVGRAAGSMLFVGGFYITGTSVAAATTNLPKRYPATADTNGSTIKITVDAASDATTGTIKGHVKYTLQHSASNKSSNAFGGLR